MNVIKIVGTVFAIVGALFIIVAVVTYQNTQDFLNGSIKDTGEVVDLIQSTSSSISSSQTNSIVYYPLVRFTTPVGDEVVFRAGVGSNPPKYRIGDWVDVRYDRANPDNVRIDSFIQLWFITILFGGLGFIFFGIGGIMILVLLKNAKKEQWLIANGQVVHAKITGVFLDNSIRVNGRNPYRITAQHHDPAKNAVFTFRSKPIWYDPKSFLRDKTIPVRIAPDNPKRYMVDITFLPTSVEG